jgi:hypothetical protein
MPADRIGTTTNALTARVDTLPVGARNKGILAPTEAQAFALRLALALKWACLERLCHHRLRGKMDFLSILNRR